MERSIDKKTEDMIINFGAFNYDSTRMAAILGWEKSEVDEMKRDQSSDFNKFYKAGKAKADYVLDLKLFEMAQGGDMKALSEFEKRTKKV